MVATILMSVAAQRSARMAEAVPYRWTNVKVGADGYAPNLVFSQAERGLGV